MQRTHTPATGAGFTLIEILVVMAIIGMLAVMVAPNIFNQQSGARRDAALSQISALEAALDTYRLDVGQYPDSLEGLVENDSGRAAWNGPYLRREVPLDPWGNEYVYDSDGRGFTLGSNGPDGERGGAQHAARCLGIDLHSAIKTRVFEDENKQPLACLLW